MSEVKLNEREQLIERILRMPNDQVEAYGRLLDVVIAHLTDAPREDLLMWLANIPIEMGSELEDALDHAIIEARRGEPGVPLDELIQELGFTREEIAEVMRREGLAE